jgi:hypothetical protein
LKNESGLNVDALIPIWNDAAYSLLVVAAYASTRKHIGR